MSPEKKGGSKSLLYILTAIAAAALMMAIAVIIRNIDDGREYANYYNAAISAYDCGDYNTALSHLRKAYTKEKTEECLLFMADCYDAQKNYDKALELLRGMDARSSSVSSRISAMEEKRGQAMNVEKVSVAGKLYPITTAGIVLDNMLLGNGVLTELSQLYALNNLSAAGNGITDIGAIRSLGGLTTLNLSGNAITDLSPLAALGNLRTLYLDGNPVTDLSPLCSLPNLTTLSIKGMEITDKQLAELSAALPNCAIHSEEATRSLSDITLGGVTFKSDVTELNLSGLGIYDLSALAHCRELNRLDLSGNSIVDLSPLMDIPHLSWLDLSDNSLSDVSPIMGLSSISTLDVSGNGISSTAPLSMLTGLVELHMDDNPIRDFSGLKKLRAIETLSLNDTGLTDEALKNLYGLSTLRLLYIEDNAQLTGEGVEALKTELPNCIIRHSELTFTVTFGNVSLRSDEKTVNLASLGIDDIEKLIYFEAVEELYLGSNNISNIYVLQHLPKLRRIDLSNNRIDDPAVFSTLNGLEYLDVSGNNIGSLFPLMGLTSLRQLYLGGNPLTEEQVQELRETLPNCEIHF